jgi:hypothetical protein
MFDKDGNIGSECFLRPIRRADDLCSVFSVRVSVWQVRPRRLSAGNGIGYRVAISLSQGSV